MISVPEFPSWSTSCLCSHYFSVHVDEVLAKVLDADRTSGEFTVTWALGVLSDGDWESLGAWSGGAVGRAFWRRIWEDIDARGVNKISLVCASDPDAWTLCPGIKALPLFHSVPRQGAVSPGSSVRMRRAEARRVVREATGVHAARIALEHLMAGSEADRAAVLSPDWPEVLEQLRPFYALRPHRRALVSAGDEYLEQLGHGLRRAVARHGPFADLPAAVSFVAQTISRYELRLKFAELSVAVPVASRPALRLVGSGMAGAAVAASPGH